MAIDQPKNHTKPTTIRHGFSVTFVLEARGRLIARYLAVVMATMLYADTICRDVTVISRNRQTDQLSVKIEDVLDGRFDLLINVS